MTFTWMFRTFSTKRNASATSRWALFAINFCLSHWSSRCWTKTQKMSQNSVHTRVINLRLTLSKYTCSGCSMMSIIGWSRNGHRSITSYIHVTEIVGQLLDLIGSKIGIIPVRDRCDEFFYLIFCWNDKLKFSPTIKRDNALDER